MLASGRPARDPRHVFFTSGDVDTFRTLGARFLGPEVDRRAWHWGVDRGADGAGVLGLVRRRRRRRVQRLPRARRATRRSGSTAATARSRTCSSTSTVEDLTAVVHHARASRPLRRHLRPARATCATASSVEHLPVYAPEGLEKFLAVAGRPTGATPSTGASSATATPPTVGDVDLRFSRTDHPPPTFAVEVTARRASASSTPPTPARTGGRARSAPGADLVLSEATYQHDDIPRADPPLGAAGRRGGAGSRARRAPDAHPPVADARPGSRRVEEGSEAFGQRCHPGHRRPRHYHLTPHANHPGRSSGNPT